MSNFTHFIQFSKNLAESRGVPSVKSSTAQEPQSGKPHYFSVFCLFVRRESKSRLWKLSLKLKKTFRLRDLSIPVSKSPVQNIVEIVQENVPTIAHDQAGRAAGSAGVPACSLEFNHLEVERKAGDSRLIQSPGIRRAGGDACAPSSKSRPKVSGF
jgi:hypothetical protein